jgi:hypothetical protein
VRLKSCGANFCSPMVFAESFTMCQTAYSVMPSPRICPIFVTRRKILPLSIPAAFNQIRNSSITQPGTGTVRTMSRLAL